MNLDEVKQQWVGVEFDRAEFAVDQQRMLDWAMACGETEPRFTDPDHPDFQAHPTFATCMSHGPALPEGFPRLGNGQGMDGGKGVTVHQPIRAGDVLTGRSHIADVYAKTGRSGTMIFIVHRTNFANQHGDAVATVDWRMIQRTGGTAD
jgi:hypothetical protein